MKKKRNGGQTLRFSNVETEADKLAVSSLFKSAFMNRSIDELVQECGKGISDAGRRTRKNPVLGVAVIDRKGNAASAAVGKLVDDVFHLLFGVTAEPIQGKGLMALMLHVLEFYPGHPIVIHSTQEARMYWDGKGYNEPYERADIISNKYLMRGTTLLHTSKEKVSRDMRHKLPTLRCSIEGLNDTPDWNIHETLALRSHFQPTLQLHLPAAPVDNNDPIQAFLAGEDETSTKPKRPRQK